MDKNFPRINQLPPYVFDEIQTLKAAARKRGEDIIAVSYTHLRAHET